MKKLLCIIPIALLGCLPSFMDPEKIEENKRQEIMNQFCVVKRYSLGRDSMRVTLDTVRCDTSEHDNVRLK